MIQAEPGAGQDHGGAPGAARRALGGRAGSSCVEPRRVAARAAALRMADLRGEPVGRTVGYRMRGEARVSDRTRVEVVTEGVFTRIAGRRPARRGQRPSCSTRSTSATSTLDLGLALTPTSSPAAAGVRVVAMSATLDAGPVAALLGGAPVVRAAGRAHPVTVTWAPTRDAVAADRPVHGAIAERFAERRGRREVRRALAVDHRRGRRAGLPPGTGRDRPGRRRSSPTGGRPPRCWRCTARCRWPSSAGAGGHQRGTRPGGAGVGRGRVEPDRSRRPGGGRRRSGPGAAGRSPPRPDPPGDRGRVAVLGRAAGRPGRATRARPVRRLWTEAEHGRLAGQADPEILHADLADLVLDARRLGTGRRRALAGSAARRGRRRRSRPARWPSTCSTVTVASPGPAGPPARSASTPGWPEWCWWARPRPDRPGRGPGRPARRARRASGPAGRNGRADIDDRLTLLRHGGREADRAVRDRALADAPPPPSPSRPHRAVRCRTVAVPTRCRPSATARPRSRARCSPPPTRTGSGAAAGPAGSRPRRALPAGRRQRRRRRRTRPLAGGRPAGRRRADADIDRRRSGHAGAR